MPAASSPSIPSLAPPRRRQPPPIPSAAASGPPSIGLDDEGAHELDLGGGDASLELDFHGGPGAAPIALPSDSGIDFMSPVDFDDPLADLPTPVGVAHDPLADLPSPVATPRDPTADLPRPVGRPPAPNAFALDLPVPVEQARAAFTEDLPVPVDFHLPTADEGSSYDGELDLPIPADLPAPREQELRPADMGVTPAELDLTPVNLDLAPADFSVTPANLGLTPAEASLRPSVMDVRPKGVGDELVLPDLPAPDHPPLGIGMRHPAGAPGATATSPPGVRPSTAALTPGRPAVSRGVLYLGGGLLLLGLAGAGVLYSGVLDPDEPEPRARRGQAPKASGGDDGSDASQGATAVAERSAAVLAKMAAHTPAGYLEARAMAHEAGDAVGEAEAGLRLHYHYGPNPVAAAEASAALRPHAAHQAQLVQRVVGLASLAAGNPDGADRALVGDEPRTRLYRGWLRLSQDRLDDAEAEATAVLAALPDEVAARHLALAVEARRDPAAAIPAIEAAVERTPQHPGLQALLAQTGIAAGHLAVARTAIDAIDPVATDDPGVQAWAHVGRARVLRAQGDDDGAIAAYDRALELVPESPVMQVERVGALLGGKRFNEASRSISELVRLHPQDQEIQLLQAEVAIASGDGDIALQVLATLAATMADDARVKLFQAEVHAMRFEVDEAKAAFAAARALDPDDVRIAIGEARLLADAKQGPAAIALLDEAAVAASERPDDVARLRVAIARQHLEAGDRAAALAALDLALAAVPEHNEAQVLRGALRIELGQTAAGRADLIAAFERTGGYRELAGPLGRLYVAEGDYDALERLLGDRLRGEQTPDDLLIAGIRLRLHQGRIEDARALVQLALTRRPSDWEAHMLLAQVLQAEGNHAEALAEIERARPARPQAELMLNHGKILEFNGKFIDAVPEYRRALALAPQLHEARFLYGRLLAYSGANSKAITELRRVADAEEAKAAPWYPEVWLRIGHAQEGLGQYESAVASLRQARTLDPGLGEAYAMEGNLHEFRNKHGEAIAALTKAIELGTPTDHWYGRALMNLGKAQAKSGKSAAAKKTLTEFLSLAKGDDASRPEAERLLREL